MLRILPAVVLLVSSTIGSACAGISSIVTIKPVHALRAAVTRGAAEPKLLGTLYFTRMRSRAADLTRGLAIPA
jgi:hypothetical protein